MTDQYLPPAPSQHDTSAYPRPLPPSGQGYGGQGYGSQGYGSQGPGWQTPAASQPVAGINPEAEYWAARYRSQRNWTRALAVGVAVALVGVLGIGAAVLRADGSSTALSAAADVAEGSQPAEGALPDGSAPQETQPEAGVPDGSLPDGGARPDGSVPEGTLPDRTAPDSSEVPLSELPLPESVQDLASFLGITDVGQILDLAVANGMMSQEDADKVRAALAVGAAIPGLLGQDQGQDATTGDPAQS